MTVIPERLAKLDDLTLDEGGHKDFNDGHCAMEVVSWLAGEGFTDAPACASPVLRRYTIALNDRWDNEKRQLLTPYLPRMVGTGNDGKDALREQVAARFLADRRAAYDAARAYYREHPLPISQQITDLAAQQVPIALELLDALIDPPEAA